MSSKLFSMPVLILPVLAVVLISGCIGGQQQTGPATGTGVAINAFEPDFSSVESGDDVRLYLKVQNLGGAVAEETIARLSGIDIKEWKLSNGKEEERLSDLTQPNLQYGTPGEEKAITWGFKSPELSQGITQTYKPSVRIYYKYKTEATKPITLVNEDELRRLVQQGKTLDSGSTQYSLGPISVDVTTGKYIKLKEDPVIPISIHIRNSGGGVVASRSGESKDDYKVNLKIELPNEMSFEGSDCKTDSDVFLWKGSEIDIGCDVRIANAPSITVEKTIKLTLEYEYYIDSSTSVTVTGKSE